MSICSTKTISGFRSRNRRRLHHQRARHRPAQTQEDRLLQQELLLETLTEQLKVLFIFSVAISFASNFTRIIFVVFSNGVSISINISIFSTETQQDSPPTNQRHTLLSINRLSPAPRRSDWPTDPYRSRISS